MLNPIRIFTPLIAGLMLVAPMAQMAQAEPAWVRDGGYLNGRSGPGLEYHRLHLLAPGTALEILERAGSWARVRGPDGDIFWVVISYLSLTRPVSHPTRPPMVAPPPNPWTKPDHRQPEHHHPQTRDQHPQRPELRPPLIPIQPTKPGKPTQDHKPQPKPQPKPKWPLNQPQGTDDDQWLQRR